MMKNVTYSAAYLIAGLAKRLEPEYGSGFSKRQLERARKFYRTYPIAAAQRPQFSWTLYKLLISISDPEKREYYELESVSNCWTARELERQKNSLLYERLLKSNDKEAVLAVARRERLPESALLQRFWCTGRAFAPETAIAPANRER